MQEDLKKNVEELPSTADSIDEEEMEEEYYDEEPSPMVDEADEEPENKEEITSTVTETIEFSEET